MDADSYLVSYKELLETKLNKSEVYNDFRRKFGSKYNVIKILKENKKILIENEIRDKDFNYYEIDFAYKEAIQIGKDFVKDFIDFKMLDNVLNEFEVLQKKEGSDNKLSNMYECMAEHLCLIYFNGVKKSELNSWLDMSYNNMGVLELFLFESGLSIESINNLNDLFNAAYYLDLSFKYLAENEIKENLISYFIS